MQIRPLNKYHSDVEFEIEFMLNGSVYAAIYHRFDKIYMSEQGEISVIKLPSCEPNHQFLSVLKTLNYVPSLVPAPQDVEERSHVLSEEEKKNVFVQEEIDSEDDFQPPQKSQKK